MFLQVSLNVLDNDTENQNIPTILAANNRDISMLCFSTEPFLLCIPVLQCKFLGTIYGTFHFYYPGKLLQTINISNLKVK